MIGRKIDKYRVEAKLGKGGMGVVYKAWDTVLERLVALKMIHPILVEDEQFLQRFRSEARALAQLENPNIVAVFDLKETESGIFIVIQYVEGETLEEKLKSGPLPAAEAVAIFKQILNAMSHAHQIGIIHRDLKPANVMITPAGVTKVMDFGLAKAHFGGGLTLTSVTAGTLYYMSPEQVRSMSDVDQRSDIYSIGMAFYESLAGRLPFEKTDDIYALARAIAKRKIQPPDRYQPSVPKALSKIVMKATAKEPKQRYQSADEMLHAIADFEHQQQDEVDPSHKKPSRPARIARQIAWNVALVVLTAFILLRTPAGPWLADVIGILSYARLSIQTEPRDAEVFANDKSIGRTPITSLRLRPDTLAIRVEKAGYLAIDTLLILQNDQVDTLDFTLQVAGTLALDLAPFGDIYLDGVLHEQGATTAQIELPEGICSLKVVHPEFGVFEKAIDIVSGRQKTQHIDFTREVMILVTSTPVSGEIWIDGVSSGVYTPNQLRVPIGKHKIEVRNPGYEPEGGPVVRNFEEDATEPLLFTLREIR